MTKMRKFVISCLFLLGISSVVFVAILFDSLFDWGWSTASNWGYYLCALFVSLALMLVSGLAVIVAGIVHWIKYLKNQKR